MPTPVQVPPFHPPRVCSDIPQLADTQSMKNIGRQITRGAAILVISGLIPLVAATPAFAARQKSIRINDASIVEGDAGQKTMTFTISWTGSKGGAAPSVHYATAGLGSGAGFATAGSDYTPSSGNASPTNGGGQCATVAIPVLRDTMNEGTFTLNLSNATGGIAIADPTGIGTIQNDDPDPTVSVGNASVIEGDIGSTTLSLPITLSGPSGREVDVDYATSDGTATAGSDYAAKTGTLVFAAGETSKQIEVTVNGDFLDEGDETFTVTLSAPFNADLGTSVATGTITNDDAGPKLVVSDATVLEGNSGTTRLIFTVAMVPVSASDVTVDYATTNGTA